MDSFTVTTASVSDLARKRQPKVRAVCQTPEDAAVAALRIAWPKENPADPLAVAEVIADLNEYGHAELSYSRARDRSEIYFVEIEKGEAA
jgi:hypothetical protein